MAKTIWETLQPCLAHARAARSSSGTAGAAPAGRGAARPQQSHTMTARGSGRAARGGAHELVALWPIRHNQRIFTQW